MFTAFVSSDAQEDTTKIKEIRIKTSAVCELCKERLEKNVGELDGVISAILDLETKDMIVKYNTEELDADDIRTTISRTGYDADDVKKSMRMFKKLPDCCRNEEGQH